MRMTLEEQEQTQTEQDQVLQAKVEEISRLVLGNLSFEREQNGSGCTLTFALNLFLFLLVFRH